MDASGAEILARLQLVQGRSDKDLREFFRSNEHVHLTVGSDPQCDWRIQEAGVAPVHFSLHWDGASLRIADTFGTGELRVDGALVGTEARRLSGLSRIDFGRASIVVKTQGPTNEERARPAPRPTLSELSAVDMSAAPARQVVLQAATPAAVGIDFGAAASRALPDHRTLQGYVPNPGATMQLVSFRVAAGESAANATPGSPDTSLARSVPESQAPRGDDTGKQVRESESVLVLSPADGGGDAPQPVRRTAQARLALPAWRAVGLSWLGLVGGYFGWLYLLYHL